MAISQGKGDRAIQEPSDCFTVLSCAAIAGMAHLSGEVLQEGCQSESTIYL